MCTNGWSYPKDKIDGECPDCGIPTVEGESYIGCFHSPVECQTCGWAPCDQSC